MMSLHTQRSVSRWQPRLPSFLWPTRVVIQFTHGLICRFLRLKNFLLIALSTICFNSHVLTLKWKWTEPICSSPLWSWKCRSASVNSASTWESAQCFGFLRGSLNIDRYANASRLIVTDTNQENTNSPLKQNWLFSSFVTAFLSNRPLR